MGNGYRFAEINSVDNAQFITRCQCCGRFDRKRTVKLIDPEGREVWFSIRCAATVMGLDVEAVAAAKKAADDAACEANAAAALAERRARDVAWQAFLDKAAGPGTRYDQIRALGGMARAREAYRSREN
jgi:ATP-dependent 26S proteasome regulatory subunit